MSTESALQSMPMGVRFRPKDEEIITYLRLKKAGKDSLVDNAIAELDIYNLDPWNLPCQSKVKSDDGPWYFFRHQVYMDKKCKRIRRKTPMGNWKLTGKERGIKDRNGKVIGSKRYLVFIQDGSNCGRTDWVMHEYSEPSDPLFRKANYVIYRLEKRTDQKSDTPEYDESGSSGDTTFDLPVAPATAPWEHGQYSEENHGLLQWPSGSNSDGGKQSTDFASRDKNPPLPHDLMDWPYQTFDEEFEDYLQSDVFGHNKIQPSSGVPDGSSYWQEIQSPFNETSQSLKWNFPKYFEVRSDAVTEGVDGQVKGHRSLALGQLFP